MSTVKLLSRIVAPDLHSNALSEDTELDKNLHDHTYGITSDPLTRFACVFSSLIHDVDHTGASNVQLVKENVCIASLYKEQSVAEQNSVDLSWNLLMRDKRYANFRNAICPSLSELQRFRQLVVNSVMAVRSSDIIVTIRYWMVVVGLGVAFQIQTHRGQIYSSCPFLMVSSFYFILFYFIFLAISDGYYGQTTQGTSEQSLG